jgi:LysM repeat protein
MSTSSVPGPAGVGPSSGSGSGRRRDAAAVTEGCPFLTGGDGSWRSAYASRAHLCAAVTPPSQLAVGKQRQLCLVAAHVSCATYEAASALGTPGGTAPAGDGAGLWPGSRTVVVTLEPVRGGLGGLPSVRTRGGGQAMLVGLMVLAFLVLVVARTATPAGPPASSPGVASGVLPEASALTAAGDGGSSPSLPAASPSPSPSGTAAPASASPSAPPGASPSPSATPAPPGPSAARRYKVKSGDTLSRIAAKFGVTVKAIQKANGITDPRLVHTGQILIIP